MPISFNYLPIGIISISLQLSKNGRLIEFLMYLNKSKMDKLVFWYSGSGHYCYIPLLAIKIIHYIIYSKGVFSNFFYFRALEIKFTKEPGRKLFKKIQNAFSIIILLLVSIHLFFLFSVFNYELGESGIKIWKKR